MTHDRETLDSFFHGRIRFYQPKAGYRFAVDAPLLADFIQTRESDTLLEWGTGNGIVSLLLSIKPFRHITAVEIQESLAELARRNIILNGLEGRISIVRDDLRHFRPEEPVDAVFSNPPYIRKGEGHLSGSQEKSIAKHELKCGISDIMQSTAEVMKPSGRGYFIFPQKRQEEFIKAAEKNGLAVQTIREVRPKEGDPANLFLSCLSRSPEGAVRQPEELPPLVLYGSGGEYSPEARAIFSGRSHG